MHAYYLHGNWIDVQGSPTRIECTSSLQAGSAPFTFAWPDLVVGTGTHAWACIHQSPHTRAGLPQQEIFARELGEGHQQVPSNYR